LERLDSLIKNFIYLFIFYLKIEDVYQDAICFSTGLIGKSGSGKGRAAQVDSKTEANISKKLQVCFHHSSAYYYHH